MGTVQTLFGEMRTNMTLDDLISELETLRRRHGNELPVYPENDENAYISGAEYNEDDEPCVILGILQSP